MRLKLAKVARASAPQTTCQILTCPPCVRRGQILSRVTQVTTVDSPARSPHVVTCVRSDRRPAATKRPWWCVSAPNAIQHTSSACDNAVRVRLTRTRPPSCVVPDHRSACDELPHASTLPSSEVRTKDQCLCHRRRGDTSTRDCLCPRGQRGGGGRAAGCEGSCL